MALFGKSLEDKVEDAVKKVRGQFPDSTIDARLDNEVVTLTGRTADIQTKTKIMAAFNEAVETKNTINQIAIEHKPATAAPAAQPKKPAGMSLASEPRTHEVAAGDTLTGMAQRYYGNASQFRKIFDANRDQLSDPDKIKVGQKLKIPM